MTTSERFWQKVAPAGPGDCWLWRGTVDSHGYGGFRVDGKQWLAHRWSYELMVGPIPEGLVIDHLCRNPPCVNPLHMEPVTSAENTRRGLVGKWQRSRTHCRNGHEYTPENTRVRPSGYRECRECARRRRRRYEGRIASGERGSR